MGPLLGLSGWKSMREGLIQSENAEVMSTTLQRSEGGAEEVPSIVVEQGDAYRPISPSRMANDRPAASTAFVSVSTEGATTSAPIVSRRSV